MQKIKVLFEMAKERLRDSKESLRDNDDKNSYAAGYDMATIDICREILEIIRDKGD